MKKICIFLVTIFLTQHSIYSAEKMSIVLFELYGNDAYEQEAEEISSQLKIDLINSGRFEIISGAKLQDEMMRENIISVRNLSHDVASDIATQLESDFYIKGEIKSAQFSTTIVIDFVQAMTQDVLFTKELPLINGQTRNISQSILHDIIAQSNLVSNITLEDISLLIGRQDFQSAEKLLQRYQFHYGQSLESDKYLVIINKGLAEEQYDSAQEYVKVFDFENALLAINKAIYYDSDNFIHRDYSEVILMEQDSFINAKLSEILMAMDRLLTAEKYDSTEILLERANAFGFESVEFKKIARRIREGKDELALWNSAQSKVWGRKYNDARVDITEAIRLNPQKPEYTEFLLELDKLERESDIVTSTWNQYKQEFSSISPVYLFGINKEFDEMVTLGFSLYGSRLYNDQITFDEISYPSLSIQFQYFKNWKSSLNWGFKEKISSGGLLYTLIFSSSFENYSDSEISQDGNGYDQLDKIVYNQLDFSITGGVSVSLFSFILGLGLEAGVGGGIHNHQTSVPAINVEDSVFTFHFTPSIGLNTWLVWNISDNLSLILSYNYKYVFEIPSIETLDTNGEHYLMLSVGYRGIDWW